MTKKETIRILKEKLNRLKELDNNRTFRCHILNKYSKDLESILKELNIDSISVPMQLDPYQHSAVGSGPSVSETNILNELISRYGELLALINPQKSFFAQYREANGKFLIFNIGAIISLCALSYYIGRDTNIGAVEKLKIINKELVDSASEMNQKLVSKQKLLDSIQIILARDQKLIQEQSNRIDSLKNISMHK